jgi:MFS family permease
MMGDPFVWCSLLTLCLCQIIFAMNLIVIAIYSGVIAHNMLPFEYASWMSFPSTLLTASAFVFLWPAQWAMKQWGYRFIFIGGVVLGLISHLLILYALIHQNFILFSLSFIFMGAYQAIAGFYRIAVAVFLPVYHHKRGIAVITGAALVAALATAPFVQLTKDIFILTPYLGTWYGLTGITFLGIMISFFIPCTPFRHPPSPLKEPLKESLKEPLLLLKEKQASLWQQLGFFYKSPSFRLGASMTIAASVLMSILMLTSPLAMLGCGLGDGAVSVVMQGHVIAMFLPALILGYCAQRVSPFQMLGAGWVSLFMALGIAFMGEKSAFFFLMMIFLGISWNLGLSGSTSLFAQEYKASERVAAQAISDMHFLLIAAVFSSISGVVFSKNGWYGILILSSVIFIGLGVIFIQALYAKKRETHLIHRERD